MFKPCSSQKPAAVAEISDAMHAESAVVDAAAGQRAQRGVAVLDVAHGGTDHAEQRPTTGREVAPAAAASAARMTIFMPSRNGWTGERYASHA